MSDDVLTAMLEKKRNAQKQREELAVPALLADEELLVIIARFEHAGMDDQAIARGIGRSVIEVAAIRAHEIYQAKLSETAVAVAVREVTVDELYAQLEISALTQMQQHLAYGADPEYAIRAAKMANTAASKVAARAGHAVNTIRNGGGGNGANVTIVLNQQFVKRLPGTNFIDEEQRAIAFDVGAPITRTTKGFAKIDAVPDAKTVRNTVRTANTIESAIGEIDGKLLSSFAIASERTV